MSVSDLGSPRGLAAPVAVRPLGVALFVLLVLVAVPIFWDGIAYLGRTWIRPEYSHGPLIPLISLYLFLRELRDFPPASAGQPVRRWPGILVLLAGLGLGIAGTVADIPDIVAYAIIVWVSGLVLTMFGWRQGLRHQLPVFHLIFMLPLPGIFYWKMSIFLQGVSSEVGVWIVAALGIPVYLEGNIIDLGVYKLHVAEACSGLRYLFPILSFSYLTAILYRGPFWHKFLLFASAAPLAVLMNSVRIGLIAVMVNSYGIEYAEGFIHLFEGWVVFLICVALLFLMAMGLQRLTRDPKSLAETIDLDFQGLPDQARRLLGIEGSAGLAVALALSVGVTAAFYLTPPPERSAPDRVSFARFPDDLGTWEGSKRYLEPRVLQVLGADDYVSISYTDSATGAQASFFSAYYVEQTEGTGIHSPEVCLPGAGWEIASFEAVTLEMPETIYGTFQANRAVILKGVSRQLVYYWFEQRGTRITNDFLAKAAVLRDSFLHGRSDGALVRFVTVLGPRESEAEAEARIQALMREVLPILPTYVPE